MAEPEITQNQPAPTVSNADAFKKRAQERDQGVAIELPSGLFMSLRRPSVTAMIKTGHIPADVAASMQNVAPGKQLQGKEMTKYLELMDLIVIHSAVAPKVVANDSDEADAVKVGEIDDQDKQFIMNYVQSGVADLKPFRTVA
jgi:hypothetical protein